MGPLWSFAPREPAASDEIGVKWASAVPGAEGVEVVERSEAAGGSTGDAGEGEGSAVAGAGAGLEPRAASDAGAGDELRAGLGEGEGDAVAGVFVGNVKGQACAGNDEAASATASPADAMVARPSRERTGANVDSSGDDASEHGLERNGCRARPRREVPCAFGAVANVIGNTADL